MTSPEFETLTSDDLVTGEAVALDLPPASLGVRMASGLLDVAVTIVLLFVALYTSLLATLRADGALLHVALVGTLVLIFIVFPTTVETLSRGKSLGKWAFGLRAVRDDAGPISFQHAFVRALVGFPEIYLTGGSVAFFSCLLSSRAKRLGDYAAGTYVVRERSKLHLQPPALMPPQLAGWARNADVAALPTGLALATRQFLARLPGLDPASRVAVGTALAEQVSPYVAPQPPPDTPPEAFLAAVIATRRERDQARLGRERAFRERLTSRRG
jgi:uncharacterized RDD family membrane protein YckC